MSHGDTETRRSFGFWPLRDSVTNFVQEDQMKRFMSVVVGAIALIAGLAAQSPVDLGTIARIKQEALTNSQVMDHVSWLADVYGPRSAGTPQLRQASEWAMKRFTEWGLTNVHQERFAFGQGWKVDRW